ncbi:hypothetical protein MTBLM5_170072 [Magnetospirillum sp. LM-5]|nr:hypothetical protein MTBLM5_170072 [Magnetospirillum sp. LM-5]
MSAVAANTRNKATSNLDRKGMSSVPKHRDGPHHALCAACAQQILFSAKSLKIRYIL